MAEILPAILPYSFEELEETLRMLAGLSKVVHVDACDGAFAGVASWPYNAHGEDEHFSRFSTEEDGFPFWDKLDYEAHLMVAHPEAEAERWIAAGATRLVVHQEALSNPKKFSEIVSGRVEVCIALNLDTSVSQLQNLHIPFDSVQCMSISEVGKQGMPFDAAVYERIAEVRKAYPGIPISVDGGINRENAAELIAAGATRLVIGSAIMQSDDIREEIGFFSSL